MTSMNEGCSEVHEVGLLSGQKLTLEGWHRGVILRNSNVCAYLLYFILVERLGLECLVRVLIGGL